MHVTSLYNNLIFFIRIIIQSTPGEYWTLSTSLTNYSVSKEVYTMFVDCWPHVFELFENIDATCYDLCGN